MSNTIQLPQNLTIHHIEQQFNELNEKLNEMGDQIVIDAKEVETVDSSGLQTLLIIAKTSIDNGKSLNWENVPEILSTSAQKIGIDQALQLQ